MQSLLAADSMYRCFYENKKRFMWNIVSNALENFRSGAL